MRSYLTILKELEEAKKALRDQPDTTFDAQDDVDHNEYQKAVEHKHWCKSQLKLIQALQEELSDSIDEDQNIEI